MPTVCPQCHEQNLPEAALCWACFAPFAGAAPQSAIRKFQSALDTRQVLGGGSLAALVAVGWLPKKLRAPALGVAFMLFLAHDVFAARERRKVPLDEATPWQRIAGEIVRQAVRIRATRIRLQHQTRGVRVDLEIDGAWREQMKLPDYVWNPLLAQIAVNLQNSSGIAAFVSAMNYEFHKVPADNGARETIELTLHTD